METWFRFAAHRASTHFTTLPTAYCVATIIVSLTRNGTPSRSAPCCLSPSLPNLASPACALPIGGFGLNWTAGWARTFAEMGRKWRAEKENGDVPQ